MDYEQIASMVVQKVGTLAGKSLVSAFRLRIAAWSEKSAAADKENAVQIKKDIAQDRTLRRQRKVNEERRDQQIQELEHSEKIASLALRGVMRWNEEIRDAQMRIEWVASRAITLADSDAEGAEAREIPDDWLKRFFKYAADVDESEILEILAQGLADAAIKERPLLSPKALDTLRFFEMGSYDEFKFCAQQAAVFESVPDDFLQNRAHVNGRSMDMTLMIELGLLKEVRRKFLTVRILDLIFTFSFDAGINSEFKAFELTYVGKSIAGLIDKRSRRLRSISEKNLNVPEISTLQIDLGLNVEVATSYSRLLISQIADMRNIDVRVLDVAMGKPVEVASFERKLHTDEFNILRSKYQEMKDRYENTAGLAFAEQFYDFDKNQLPYLYPKE